MTCGECERLYSALGAESPGGRLPQEAQAHLAACPGCGEGFRALGRGLAALRAEGREPVPEGFAGRVLERAFELKGAGGGPLARGAGARGPGRGPGVLFPAFTRAFAAAAAAAVAVLAFALGWERGQRDAGERHASEVGVLSHLGEELRASADRARALEEEVRRLSTEVASLRVRGEGPALAGAAAGRPVERREVLVSAAAFAVAFDRRAEEGGDLTIDLHGPDSRVVPELIALARSEDEELAGLALRLLRKRVRGAIASDVEGVAEPAGETAGRSLLQTMGRWIGGVTEGTELDAAPGQPEGREDGPGAAPAEPRSARRLEVSEIERLWRAGKLDGKLIGASAVEPAGATAKL